MSGVVQWASMGICGLLATGASSVYGASVGKTPGRRSLSTPNGASSIYGKANTKTAGRVLRACI